MNDQQSQQQQFIQSHKKIKSLYSSFEIEQYLGSGQFGHVFKAKSISEENYGLDLAIKVTEKKKLFANSMLKSAFSKEITVMKKLTFLNNSNIVKIYEYFEDQQYCYMVLEYCNSGDLYDMLKKQGPFNESQAVEYMKQILNACFELQNHKPKIIHRDIKLENIFVHKINNEYIMKLGDFGFVREVPKDNLAGTGCGSPLTMAPEILGQSKDNKYNTEKVDIYSLGVILYQMLFQAYPYRGLDDVQILQNIQKGDLKLQNKGIQLSEDMQTLLKSMLAYNLSDRIEWDALFSHKFFKLVKKEEQIKKIDENVNDEQKENSNEIAEQSIQPPEIQKSKDNIVKTYKICLLGDYGVGKTSIIKYLLSDKIKNVDNLNSLDGMEIEIDVGLSVINFVFVDTAGEEKNNSQLQKQYYQNIDGFFIVYSLLNQQSFKNVQRWIDQVKQNGQENIPMIFLANKFDLVQTSNDQDEIRQKCREVYKVNCKVISAKTGFNINQSIIQLGQAISIKDINQSKLGSRFSKNQDYNNNISIMRTPKKQQTEKQSNCCK